MYEYINIYECISIYTLSIYLYRNDVIPIVNVAYWIGSATHQRTEFSLESGHISPGETKADTRVGGLLPSEAAS